MDFRAGRAPDGSRDASTFGDAASAPAIRSGDMVVFFEGREAIGFDRMKAKSIWQCRHGAFHHDEIVGKPFGSRVFSRTTKGYVYALSPTPELWSHVVPNRTQIVQDFDQSIVIFRLDLKPGDLVVESGTGSGVMSSAIVRTIAPSGFLHTFEFNEIRATRAQEEFEENGLGGLVKVAHRDVCASRADGGGFGEGLDGKADAVFLDLPEPWLAVRHAKSALKPGKKVCSYSPCIEQVMKTCEGLRAEGFHSVTTIEFRLRTINYAEVQLEVPDFGLPTVAPAAQSIPEPLCSMDSPAAVTETGTVGAAVADAGATVDVSGTAPATVEASVAGHDECERAGSTSPNAANGKSSARGGNAGGTESKLDQNGPSEGVKSSTATDGGGERHDGASDGVANKAQDKDADLGASRTAVDASNVAVSNKRPREEAAESCAPEEGAKVSAGRGRNERLLSKAAIRAAEAAAAKRGERKPPLKLVCAQPYPIMRGHTAFLTFAIAPVARRPTVAPAKAGAHSIEDAGKESSADGMGDRSVGIGDSQSKLSGGVREMDVVCEEESVVEGKGKGEGAGEGLQRSKSEDQVGPPPPPVSDNKGSPATGDGR